MKVILLAPLLLTTALMPLRGLAAVEDLSSVEKVRHDHTVQFFEKELKLQTPIYRGWARLYLNRELPQGNADIRKAYAGILAEIGKGAAEMTPAIAGDEGVKWQMRNWVRIYFSFGDRSRILPRRLEPETQRLIENLFWNYVCDKSRFERAHSMLATEVHGSENHEMMHYSNALMALQALKDQPEYRDRKLPDGRTVQEHYAEWNAYYKHHCQVRGMYGDQVELFSDYWRFTMPELLNICDLSDDPLLQDGARMLLDVLWADWAVAQLNGSRGGCALREYQETGPDAGELRRGSGEGWTRMSGFLFDRDNWWNCNPWWHSHPIRGESRILAMTGYRLPDVIKDIANDTAGRGESVFVARRLSRQRAMSAKDVPVTFSPWYALDTKDSRMLSYEFCTPDVVLGALIIDPTEKFANSTQYLSGKDLEPGYPALTAQNRYQAIQFATGRDARVVPQCLGLEQPDNHKTYNQQQAIQHKNLLIVQRNPKGRGGTGPMRIYFATGMKNRLIQNDGWFFLQEGSAYLAVKAFARGGHDSSGYVWDNEFWLRPKDQDAPVLFAVGRTNQFPSMDKFISYIGTLAANYVGAKFTVTRRDSDGTQTTLSLYTDRSRVPEVNNQPVNFTPEKLYDSPFLTSAYGRGIVTIQKGTEKLVLDFNQQTPTQTPP